MKQKTVKKRIEKDDLLRELELVKPGVSSREFIEQSSCFAFNKEGEVLTFNDEVACRMPSCLAGAVEGAVQAGPLMDILQKMPTGSLLVLTNEDGQLEFRNTVKRKNGKLASPEAFGIIKDKKVFLPIDRVEDAKGWKPLPKHFNEAAKQVQQCVSRDENRFILTCVHLTRDFMEACDDQQAMRYNIGLGIDADVIVRGTSLDHLEHLNVTKVAMTENWLHFKNERNGLIFSCRRYAESYPSLDKVNIFDAPGSHKVTIPTRLKETCEKAAVFAMDQAGDPHMEVYMRPRRMEIRGEGYAGWYFKSQKTDYEGPEMTFFIKPELLLWISTQKTIAKISKRKLKITGPSSRWIYTTVLTKRKQAEPEKK